MRLLVTEDAPAYGVLAALRALRSEGYDPWVAVTRRGGYSLHSRARGGVVKLPDPLSAPDAYISELVRVAQALEATAVLPGTEVGLVALAAAEEAFPTDVKLGTPSQETVARATDKLELQRLAALAGLSTPSTVTTTPAEIEAGVPLQLPAIVKARRSCMLSHSHRYELSFAHRVVSRAQLLEAARSMPGDVVLVQPVLEGRLRAVCGVAWQGELVTAVHQVSPRIYPAGCGITAFAETVAPEPGLEMSIGRMIEELGWSGIFQTQFIEAPQGHCLIDLNPRMYGSLGLAVAAGANLPGIWAALLRGASPEIRPYETGVRFRSEERELATLVTAAAAADWRTVGAVLRPRRKTAHALGTLRDPLPLLIGGRVSRMRRARARVRR